MDQHQQAGRLPYRFWVGVTGHRQPRRDPAVAERVREVLGRIRDAVGDTAVTPVRFGVVSSLAEGADRVVAREVLAEEDARLEATLPFPADKYVADFPSPDSREEFQELRERAEAETVVPSAARREQAYAKAGFLTVDRCDALIAVWDGAGSRGEGGTADVVDYARGKRIPVYRIRTDDGGRYEIVEERSKGVGGARLREVAAFNRARVSSSDLTARVDEEAGRLRASAEGAGLATSLVEPSLRWYLPYLARADALSRRLQRWYYNLGLAMFVLTAAAAVLGAVQLASDDAGRRSVGIGQVALLFLLIALAVVAWRRRLPSRWISCRLLAEQLRAAMFLTVAGVGTRPDRADLVDPSLDWVQASLVEVYGQGPRLTPREPAAPALSRFLADAWIGHQHAYLVRRRDQQSGRERLIGLAVSVLFALTFLLAVIAVVRNKREDLALEIALTALPALAAAIGGIREQRQYVRNAERSRRVAARLERLRDLLEAAPDDLDSVKTLAAAAGSLLSEENQDWFGVMRPGDLRPTPP